MQCLGWWSWQCRFKACFSSAKLWAASTWRTDVCFRSEFGKLWPTFSGYSACVYVIRCRRIVAIMLYCQPLVVVSISPAPTGPEVLWWLCVGLQELRR